MLIFLYTVLKFARALRHLWIDPEFRVLLTAVAAHLGLGTFFYWFWEDWTVVDAFYFSVVSVLTVGYGDLTPQTDLGKLFTVFFLLFGVGLFVAFVAHVASAAVQMDERMFERGNAGLPQGDGEDGEGNP